MTSKIAKCERIFSNGESSVKLEIDYQTKRYSISPCGDDLVWGFNFLNREVSEIPKDLALLDLMSQAIKFAEEELKEKGEGEKDKLQEPEKRKIETTMGEVRKLTQSYVFWLDIPDSAKVTIEWTE